MTGGTLGLILLAVVALVGGQVLQKLAMRGDGLRGGRRVVLLIAGIGAMTVWFLVWLALMRRMPLSRLFPFEGLASVLLSLAASAILRERVSLRMWLGVGLIAIGVAIVGASFEAPPG